MPNNKPLREQLIGPLKQNEEDLTVQSIRRANEWDLSPISFQIPKVLLEIITSTYIPFNDNSKDKAYWTHSPNDISQ